jgi:hypothetical protein
MADTVGQQSVGTATDVGRTNDRGEPDDRPVTSGQDTADTLFDWRSEVRQDFPPTVTIYQAKRKRYICVE